jgi:hypothetical protein
VFCLVAGGPVELRGARVGVGVFECGGERGAEAEGAGPVDGFEAFDVRPPELAQTVELGADGAVAEVPASGLLVGLGVEIDEVRGGAASARGRR